MDSLTQVGPLRTTADYLLSSAALRFLISSLRRSARQASCAGSPRSLSSHSFSRTGLLQMVHGTEVRRSSMWREEEKLEAPNYTRLRSTLQALFSAFNFVKAGWCRLKRISGANTRPTKMARGWFTAGHGRVRCYPPPS